MNNKHRGRSVGQWLWITILLLLFAATIAWLANPIGETDNSQQHPRVSETEWTVQPSGPTVDIRLPVSPLAAPSPQATKHSEREATH